MHYIGIDNGVTGAITVLDTEKVLYHAEIPIKKYLSYTKKKQFVNRVMFQVLRNTLEDFTKDMQSFCMIERPMVNPMRFKASISALRCLEATEIILEDLDIPYQFVDSKEWQKVLLPSGLKGEAELKMAALEVARRLFPKTLPINADSLLIAEYCRRTKRFI